VTLDLLEVNLFTGEALLIKYGAAPSLLLREGKTRTLSCIRLPAGLEETDTADPPPLRLLPGDRLLLLSDGLWDSPSVQAALQQPCPDPPEALCARLLALAAADKVPDDCTLLVADFLQG
jgi:stage II sporulation protein E